jgi:hypothetical protein
VFALGVADVGTPRVAHTMNDDADREERLTYGTPRQLWAPLINFLFHEAHAYTSTSGIKLEDPYQSEYKTQVI